ncbi:MAG TPA: NAD(P)H-binding protein [Gemmatimonadaceae bacterium]|nr:NAD(P)H-binding protein [Gemmatimonadaceae bacterium]
MPSVALLGATGLVGRHTLDLLANDPHFSRVVVLARRKFAEAMAPRVEAHIVEFERLHERPDLLGVDQVICALGTTIKAVGGSKEKFRAVDYGIPLAAAKIARQQGARHFLLVSALGASAESRIFYSRVKGELEDALRTLPFRSVTILRPSLLLGDRNEFRLGEEVARRFAFLVPGKYRPIHAKDVAAALVRSAKEDVPGLHILESDEILTGYVSPP